MAAQGHEDRFPPASTRGSNGFGEATFRRARTDGRGAPFVVICGTATEVPAVKSDGGNLASSPNHSVQFDKNRNDHKTKHQMICIWYLV
jgi:hypothetical protein